MIYLSSVIAVLRIHSTTGDLDFECRVATAYFYCLTMLVETPKTREKSGLIKAIDFSELVA